MHRVCLLQREPRGKDRGGLVMGTNRDKPYTEDELQKKIERFRKEHGNDECTCEICIHEKVCRFSWDPYNVDGDCLAGK